MLSGFMVNAWVVAGIVAVVAGAVGFFVVLRGSAFVADALPTGAFAGRGRGEPDRRQHAGRPRRVLGPRRARHRLAGPPQPS